MTRLSRRVAAAGQVSLALLPLAAAALITAPSVPPASAARAAAGTATAANADDDVQLRITDITPTAPGRAETPTPLQIRFTATNTTSDDLRDVTVAAFRGDPVGNQRQLDDVIADPAIPADRLPLSAAAPVTVQLPPRTTVAGVFTTSISKLNEGNLCQCQNAVYPLHLTAAQGGGSALGAATSFIPSQVDPTTKTDVGWVWPIIDRPHRLTEESVFTDDDLASSVAGGRLDRVLQVVEGLNPAVPMNLVVDPELLDELSVMATGQYTVQAKDDAATPGTGQQAARAWLGRFATLLVTHPASHVSLTPYADPDVQTLARNEVGWSSAMPAAMTQRVTQALAGRPVVSDLAWPAGGAVQTKVLESYARAGARSVVVDGSALQPATRGGIPIALARLRTAGAPGGSLAATATSPAMQRQVAEAVSAQNTDAAATSGSTVLPYLVAETTIRSVQSDDAPSYAVLTPPRYVDPDPTRAVRTIETTSVNPYATPVDVRSLGAGRTIKTAALRSSAATAGRALPAANVDADRGATESLSAVTAMLGSTQDADQVVAGLAAGAQRVASSAWRPLTTSPFPAGLAARFASGLDERVSGILRGVAIITPSSGSGNYTLGSRDSSLPITVENKLPYPVTVELSVTARDGLPGYQMGDLGPQRIAANSKETVQVPSRLERSGRIPIVARLSAPTGRTLGVPVDLYVRSTVFGTIGVVITLVAGGVLAIALIVRFGKRLARLRRKSAREAADNEPRTPAGSATA